MRIRAVNWQPPRCCGVMRGVCLVALPFPGGGTCVPILLAGDIFAYLSSPGEDFAITGAAFSPLPHSVTGPASWYMPCLSIIKKNDFRTLYRILETFNALTKSWVSVWFTTSHLSLHLCNMKLNLIFPMKYSMCSDIVASAFISEWWS